MKERGDDRGKSEANMKEQLRFKAVRGKRQNMMGKKKGCRVMLMFWEVDDVETERKEVSKKREYKKISDV